MKTIKSLIVEELKYRVSRRAIERDERVEDTYYKYPQLEKMDQELVSLRGSRMLAIFEKNEEPVKAIDARERELLKERKEFISQNGIDPEFDEEKPICGECHDTGYVPMPNGNKAVCRTCMKSEIEECFEYAGLSDYSSYKIKSYDKDYFGDKKARNEHLKAMMALMDGGYDGNMLRLYSDVSGHGKTFLAVIVTKTAILQGKSAYYIKAENFIDFSEESKDQLKKYDMLIIDDYSAEVTRKWQIASSINAILEARLAAQLPTVLISSAGKEQLVMESDERIAQKIKRSELI